MLLAMLLHFVQHIAYGYSLAEIISHESFLNGVVDAKPWRRVGAMAVCASVAGFGWWAVYAYGRPLVSIKQAVKSHEATMPLATVGHALLQIVTVGLGSPLGREVAPREIGALLATWLVRKTNLSAANTRIMIACGAGAGLAAVYNVPLGGAVFTLEVMLQTFSIAAAVPAIITSVIAALVAWIGLGNASQYRMPDLQVSTSLILWSTCVGPIFGYGGQWYARLATAARARAPRNWRLVPWCGAVFILVGVAAVPFPHLLGNGRGPIQLGLDSDISLRLAAELLALKLIATTACLRAGAEGGMLTPGMTIGALLATAPGIAWTALWPGIPIGAFAVVGVTAFLASSMTMPLTAVVLVLEFTRVSHDFLIPMLLAVGGSMATNKWCRS
ncbi:chloride channel protein [Lichenifustis flavocetrariae]|uniref:Chloride channel protein n=1 Tax=Lichenifustis flavocetrariae TaxID=2949735 RepID=A0AA41Z9L0_9HYPH|nr:chloride channel protein [Lichenifustis flavocetrariae]